MDCTYLFFLQAQVLQQLTNIQWKVNNDLTYEQIAMGVAGRMAYVSYRDGVIAFSGKYGSGAGGDHVFMWSEDDGQTWTIKKLALETSYPFGIKGDGKFATVHDNGGWKLYEFDPVTQTYEQSGFPVTYRPNKVTLDGGVLTFGFGTFTDLVKEGDIEPVGVVGSTDASAKTITFSTNVGDWSAGTDNYGLGPVVTEPSGIKYLEHDASGNVTELLDEPQDPPYTTSDPDPSLTLQFPASLNGDPCDSVIQPGSAIAVTVRADNTAGSAGPANDKIVPVGSTRTAEDIEKIIEIEVRNRVMARLEPEHMPVLESDIEQLDD